MLGPVDAAADKNAPLAVEYGHADAGAIWQGFEAGHALRPPSFRHVARDVRASAEIAAVAARSESIARPRKASGRPAGRPWFGIGSRRASSAPRTSDSADKLSSSGCRE